MSAMPRRHSKQRRSRRSSSRSRSRPRSRACRRLQITKYRAVDNSNPEELSKQYLEFLIDVATFTNRDIETLNELRQRYDKTLKDMKEAITELDTKIKSNKQRFESERKKCIDLIPESEIKRRLANLNMKKIEEEGMLLKNALIQYWGHHTENTASPGVSSVFGINSPSARNIANLFKRMSSSVHPSPARPSPEQPPSPEPSSVRPPSSVRRGLNFFS